MNGFQNSEKLNPHVERKQERAIQAVIFDLDGVLMNSEMLAFEVWKEIVGEYGGKLDPGAYSGMVGLSAEETAVFCMQYSGVTFHVEEVCALAWQRVIERLGTKIDPLPGAGELVHELARRGYPLAIASNSPVYYIENALSGLNLLAYFSVRTGIDEVAEGKPAPDIYLTAARRLNVAPEHCLAVEDSRVGVQAAATAGMRVLAVPAPHDHRNGFERAWRVFGSLNETLAELDVVLKG